MKSIETAIGNCDMELVVRCSRFCSDMARLSADLSVFLLTLTLVAGACQSSTVVDVTNEAPLSPQPLGASTQPPELPSRTAEATESADAPPREPDDSGTSGEADALVMVPDEISLAIANIATGYRSGATAWDGFVPNDYPVVLALKDSNGMLTGALAINHPVADRLGDATSLDTYGTPFTSLHLIENPAEGATLQALETFEFRVILGGVDSFAMVAGGRDEFFDPTTKTYVSTLVHEMFHRYQGEMFSERGGEQDIDGYDYSPASLVLIGLEERALSAAIGEVRRQERELAARHYVAIRFTRLGRESRVALDGRQEVREGTARYIEHVLGGDDVSYEYHLGNFGDYLMVDIPSTNIKANMAFGRWYASGAATLHLLAQLDVADVSGRIDRGETPVEVLADVLGVDPVEYDQLVQDARAAYDSTGVLSQQAGVAAEAVLTEPSFWGGPTAGLGSADAEQVALTQAEVDCLVERGVVFTAEQLEISEAAWEACYIPS